MSTRITILSAAAVLVSAMAVGCQHDGGSLNNDSSQPSSSGSSMSGTSGSMSSNGKPLEGNPGATTNQTSGYPQSDPGAYHPQTDDTKQYRPANAGTVQPNR